jgi:hypothetical protein
VVWELRSVVICNQESKLEVVIEFVSRSLWG